MGLCSRSNRNGHDTDPDVATTENVVTSKNLITTTTAEIDICCKNCKSNKLLLYFQTIVNVVFLVFIIILFIMVRNLGSKIETELLPMRTNAVYNQQPNKGYVVKEKLNHTTTSNTSKIKNDTVNIQDKETFISTLPPRLITTKAAYVKTESKFLDKLEILFEKNVEVKRKKEPLYPIEKINYGNLLLPNNTNCTCLGMQGPRGPKGKRGKRGGRGFDGKLGKEGPRGKPGKKGPNGDVGPMGLQGERGFTGSPGKPGTDGRQSNLLRPVAHITGHGVGRLVKQLPSKGIITSWEKRDGFSTVNGGFSLSNSGHLTIPKYGFYHVYSQIFFNHDVTSINPVLKHYVYLIKPNGQIWIILRGYATKPIHVKGNQGFYTTNANGLFRLRKGEKLVVGVAESQLPLVSYSESATFFGAYMV